MKSIFINGMKALFGLLLMGALITGCERAEEELINQAADNQVAVGAYDGFMSAFPDAQNVKWSHFGFRVWQASFTQGSQQRVALVHPNGTILDTGTSVDFATLPMEIKTYLASQYPDAGVQTVLTGEESRFGSPFRVIIMSPGSRVWRVSFGANGQFAGVTEL